MLHLDITIDIDGAIAVVTLNRPDRLNAFTAESYRALADALRALDVDPTVHAVLLEGAGTAFSSGADLDALAAGNEEEFGAAFFPLIETLSTMRTPLVAGVHGVAVGFGATLLLHCDVVVVADDARIRFPFTALGTAPEAGSSVLLARTVGAQRAAELILTARWVDGREAERIGLAARAVPAGEVRAAARATATAIAGHPFVALVEAKQLLRDGVPDEVAAAVLRETDAARRLSRQLGGIGRRAG